MSKIGLPLTIFHVKRFYSHWTYGSNDYLTLIRQQSRRCESGLLGVRGDLSPFDRQGDNDESMT